MDNIITEILNGLFYTIYNFGGACIKAVYVIIIELLPLSKITNISWGQVLLAYVGITGITATIILFTMGLIFPFVKKHLNKKVL